MRTLECRAGMNGKMTIVMFYFSITCAGHYMFTRIHERAVNELEIRALTSQVQNITKLSVTSLVKHTIKFEPQHVISNNVAY